MTTRRSTDDHLEKMTSDQVADLLGHPSKTIPIWVRDGKLPARKEPGSNRWWFARNELQVLKKGPDSCGAPGPPGHTMGVLYVGKRRERSDRQ